MIKADQKLTKIPKEATVSTSSVQEAFKLSTPDELYIIAQGDSRPSYLAKLSLELRSWMTQIVEFDPVTGEAQNSSLLDTATLIHDLKQHSSLHDLPSYICVRIEHALSELLIALRYKIQREYELQPIYSVREIDFNTTLWLSKKPGRNVREKLAKKPYLKAVKRRPSFDTAENRLLKTFTTRFSRLLDAREDLIQNRCDQISLDLNYQMGRLIRSEAFEEIKPWGNLPPNNTLLSHRSYRKIWDAWLLLQRISEDMAKDLKYAQKNSIKVLYWELATALICHQNSIVPQQPLTIDFFKQTLSHPKNLFGLWLDGQEQKYWTLDYQPDTNQIICFFHTDLLTISLLNDHIELKIKKKSYQYNALKYESLAEIKQFIFKDIFHISLEINREQKQVLKQEEAKKLNKTLSHKSASVDFFTTTPQLSFDQSNLTSNPIIPSLVIQQWTSNPAKIKHDQQADAQASVKVLCNYAQALHIDEQIMTMSVKSILHPEYEASAAQKSDVLKALVGSFKKDLPFDHVNYLFPDVLSDFELSALRKSIRFHYTSSKPLPKSIAGLFSLLKHQQTFVKNMKFGDVIIMVDFVQDKLSLTPIMAADDPQLKAKLPNTKGIVWERHPTRKESVTKDLKQFKQELNEKYNLQVGSTLTHVYGAEELSIGRHIHSTLQGQNWTHLEAVPPFKVELKQSHLDAVLGLLNLTASYQVKVVNLSPCVHFDNIRFKAINLSNYSVTEGAEYLSELERDAQDLPLWKDHLPPLWIKPSRFAKPFALVDNVTIVPSIGQIKEIPIFTTFELPANKEIIKFSLIQGQGQAELDYFATIKSPQLPLEQATVCKLKMSYTYGAEEPYKLEFIPLSNESKKQRLKSMLVHWQAKEGNEEEEIDLSLLPVPSLPTAKTFEELRRVPRENTSNINDIPFLVQEMFELHESINQTIDPTAESEEFDYECGFMKGSNFDTNGNLYIFVYVPSLDTDVFCHQSRFLYPVERTELWRDMEVFLKVEKDKKGKKGSFKGVDVSFGNPCIQLRQKERKNYLLNRLKQGTNFYRFISYTMWGNGRSLSWHDTSLDLQQAAARFMNTAEKLCESDQFPNKNKRELKYLISIMHQDISPYFVQDLLKIPIQEYSSAQGFFGTYQKICYAIGSAHYDWQKSLLNRILDSEHLGKEALKQEWVTRALYIIFWRGGLLTSQLEPSKLEEIAKYLTKRLVKLTKQVLKANSKLKADSLYYNFEAMLGLLLSRHNPSEQVRTVLSPQAEVVSRYFKCLEDLDSFLKKSANRKHKSRIELALEKPPEQKDTPDLVYALKLYLSGDDGAGSIRILEINQE